MQTFSHLRRLKRDEKKWDGCAEASYAAGDIAVTNPWLLDHETQLWPKTDTSWPFPWLDEGILAECAQSRVRGAAADTWVFCHQHTFQTHGQTLETTNSLVWLSYMKLLIMLLFFSAPLKAGQICWWGDKSSFRLVLKQVG